MHAAPIVDINLFVHNGAATVAAAIDSVLAQSWTSWRLTLIDDGSIDATPDILAGYAARHPAIGMKRNRCRTGAVGAFQRGFWLGDADYVMPKSADDLIAPDFIERLMTLLQDHTQCVMAHAAGLSFAAGGKLQFLYPTDHCLHAVDADPVVRATHVMSRYASAPSFWGIYRREAVDRLAPIACRAGWDHVLLAELALYGEIRHVTDALLWRRGTARPLAELARAATAEAPRGISLDDPLADPLWCAPCITTAYAHVENILIARLDPRARDTLLAEALRIFVARWGDRMQAECATVRTHVAAMVQAARRTGEAQRRLAAMQLTRLLDIVGLLLPAVYLQRDYASVNTLITEHAACPT